MRGEVHQVMVIGTGFCRFVKVIFLLLRDNIFAAHILQSKNLFFGGKCI